jgi:hypothetical protein
MTQYVVVMFPYAHLQPEAIGPFRSGARAEAAAERIRAVEDAAELDWGVAPQVVPLSGLRDALVELQGVAP